MADSTLNAIRIKIRRITRSPSPSQISDATIDEYVNTFIHYFYIIHRFIYILLNNVQPKQYTLYISYLIAKITLTASKRAGSPVAEK